MSKMTRAVAFNNNSHVLRRFITDFEFSHEALNDGYQIRIEGLVDFYSVNQRYHILTTHERGDWENAGDLRKIMLKALPNPSQDLKDNFVGANSVTTVKSEGFMEIGKQPQVFNVLSIPAPKRLWPRLIWAKLKRLLHV